MIFTLVLWKVYYKTLFGWANIPKTYIIYIECYLFSFIIKSIFCQIRYFNIIYLTHLNLHLEFDTF